MPHRILILNPNCNQSMTDSLRAPIESLNYNNTEYTYLTAPPTSPHSINNLHDAELSTTACLPLFTSPSPSHFPNHPSPSPSNPQHPHPNQQNQQNEKPYAAILIACFSPHPLVPALLSLSTCQTHPHQHPLITPNTYIIDIFAASVSVACQLLSTSSPSTQSPSHTTEQSTEPKATGKETGQKAPKFTIISTGPQWRRILSSAIFSPPTFPGRGEALGPEMAKRVFGGVECVGLDAGELHPTEPGDGEGKGDGETIKAKVQSATKRLLGSGDVGVMVLGCAGMVGMEGWVREEISRRGEEEGGVKVVDGVKAGVGVLQGLLRGGS